MPAALWVSCRHQQSTETVEEWLREMERKARRGGIGLDG